MHRAKVLFTAPFDFHRSVMDEYVATFDMRARPSEDIEIWLCDPKAPFVISWRELEALPNLRILATPSTGTNHIDLNECKKRGIEVISLCDNRDALEYISASAEFTFKLLLDALRIPPARELQDKTVGLVGLGRIGRRVQRWCYEFDAKRVLYTDPAFSEDRASPIEDVFRLCDAVVICCTLNDQTRGMVTKELLQSMKTGAALVNTARGEIVDEVGLLEVMDERIDLRVALDVLEGETCGKTRADEFKRRGAIITPHIAGETVDSRTKAAKIIYDLIVRKAQ